MQFDVAGPFAFDPNTKGKQWQAEFWKNIQMHNNLEGLDLAIECYVFCVKKGGATVPWYVGQAKGKRGFRGEIFNDSKMLRYRDVPAIKYKNQDACAEMILFPVVTETYRKVARGNTERCKKAIDWLETELISRAVVINPKLKNVAHAIKLKTMSVNGIFGKQPQGQPTIAARYVRDMFQFGDRIKPKTSANQSK